jgi:hypothetical protein
MKNRSARFKCVVWLSVIAATLLIPASALAWFCGSGRMTGGGKLIQVSDSSGTTDDVFSAVTTNGYELHCDGSLPNNLEINRHDPNGTKFKLDVLQSANCITLYGNQKPPAANFDTFEGVGIGTWKSGNDSIPACAEWIFIDGQGTPQNNSDYIRITTLGETDTSIDICPAVGGTSTIPACSGTTLLQVGTPITGQVLLRGQNQAHK